MATVYGMMAQSNATQLPRFTGVWQNNHALAPEPIIACIAAAPAMPALPANPSPLLALALREGSELEADWMWYAKRMLEPQECEYCQRRAEWIRATQP